MTKQDDVKLTNKRENKKYDLLEFNLHHRNWFRYTGYEADAKAPQLIVRATRIGEKIPPELLQMPDPRKFSKELRWEEDRLTDPDGAVEFAGKLAFKYRLWLTKTIIAMGAEQENDLRLLVPNMSRKDLLERDQKLGAIYLEELKAQNFPLPSGYSTLLKD